MSLDPADFPPDYRLCAVCGRPLEKFLSVYAHLQHRDDDHVPVPVAVGDLAFPVICCDFCNADVPDGGWVLPASSFQTSLVGVSADNWSVCAGCLPDVRAGRWAALATRAARALVAGDELAGQVSESQVRADLLATYQLLAEHVTGAPYPAGSSPHTT